MLKAEAARPGGPRGAGMKAPIDEEIEAFLMDRLAVHFPDDAVVSEESGGRPGTSGRAFVIDPHDGTRDFLQGRRETSISIALATQGRLELGLVYAPFASERTGPKGMLVSWATGEPVRHNGQALAPRPSAQASSGFEPGDVVLASTRLKGERLEDNRRRLSPAQVVPCASIATRFALVALGKAQAGFTFNNPLSDWDFAGGQALLEAMGAALVGPDGQRVSWSGTGSKPAKLNGYFAARDEALAKQLAARFADLTGG